MSTKIPVSKLQKLRKHWLKDCPRNEFEQAKWLEENSQKVECASELLAVIEGFEEMVFDDESN